MFKGEYLHTLDEKGRLTVPSAYRAQLAGGLVITRGYDPCLVIYTQEQWAELASKAAGLPAASRAARAHARWVFGSAFDAVPDKLGRIVVPAVLRDYASIGESAIIVGVNARIEVWDPSKYRDALARDMQDIEQNAADLAQMGM